LEAYTLEQSNLDKDLSAKSNHGIANIEDGLKHGKINDELTPVLGLSLEDISDANEDNSPLVAPTKLIK